MKTLDELDALWSEASDSGHGAAVFFNAIYAAWPEVRERLRRAEAVETAAQTVFAVQGPPYDIDDYTQRMHALRAALTEEPRQ